MRTLSLALALLFSGAAQAGALSVDELIAKNIEARGGIEKIKAINSLKLTGKIRAGGGGSSIELAYAEMRQRPGLLRSEVSWQGLTAVTAFDGSVGWQVQPFQGRRDPEKIAADEVRSLRHVADIEGPLVDCKAKGNTVEYMGTEDVDGTDAHKLKVTFNDGDVRYVYLDPDYFLEIRVLDQVRIRGAEYEQETDLGNYELVEGVYMPFAVESGGKGGPKGQKIIIEKAEVNVAMDEALFRFPAAATAEQK